MNEVLEVFNNGSSFISKSYLEVVLAYFVLTEFFSSTDCI